MARYAAGRRSRIGSMRAVSVNVIKVKAGEHYWFDIDWRKCQAEVKRMQIDIAVAWKAGNVQDVKTKQQKLVNSFAAKAIAVKTVTGNKGKKTPGIDKVLWDSPKHKWEAIHQLEPYNFKALAVRRVWIPKKNGKLRPLGIPTMKDRAMQTLWKLALEPIAETMADQHSYGYRPYRSTQDAAQILWLFISKQKRPWWVLEADIKGFFDNIHHEWIMENIPIAKSALKQFLKAGHLDKGVFYETEAGVPQGGSISPTIANMTLDGLQEHLKRAVNAYQQSCVTKKPKSPWVHLVRFADDFVVTAASKRILQDCVKPAVVEFLKVRGLELSQEKTLITNVKQGFKFVGFNIRVYQVPHKKGGYICLVKPTKDSIQKMKDKVKNIVDQHKGKQAYDLIQALNPVIMGWANYYHKVSSNLAFKRMHHFLFQQTLRWIKWKHPKQGVKEVVEKYYIKVGTLKWVFYGNKDNQETRLFQIIMVPIRRHSLIQNKNPYLPEDLEYFVKREKLQAEKAVWSYKKRMVGKSTDFICNVCGLRMRPYDDTQIHHKLPKKNGGTDQLRNLILLHTECHKQVTYTKNPATLARFKEQNILIAELLNVLGT